jgi:hypothetical protein
MSFFNRPPVTANVVSKVYTDLEVTHPHRSHYGYHMLNLKAHEEVRLFNFLVLHCRRMAKAQHRFDRKLPVNAEVVWEKVITDGRPTGWRLVPDRKNERPADPPVPYQMVATSSGSYVDLPTYNFVDSLYRTIKPVYHTVSEVAPDVFRGVALATARVRVLLPDLRTWFEQNRPGVLAKFRDRSLPRPGREKKKVQK